MLYTLAIELLEHALHGSLGSAQRLVVQVMFLAGFCYVVYWKKSSARRSVEVPREMRDDVARVVLRAHDERRLASP